MKTVLFETQHLYYLPQFLPLIRCMATDPEFRLLASISAEAEAWEKAVFQTALKHESVECILENNESRRHQRLNAIKPDVIVVGNIGQLESVATDNSLVVMIYHGIGLKKSYYRDVNSRVDLIAVESPRRYDEWRRLGISPSKLVLTGFLKLDLLLEFSAEDRRSWLRDRGMDHTRPTVLYAPTFYPSSIEKVIPAFQDMHPNFNLLIKLHHFSWELEKYRHHLELIRPLAEKAHVYLAQRDIFDVVPLYAVSDVMVTDISSTLFEFLAVNRPIIQCLLPTYRKKHRWFPFIINRRLDHQRMAQINFTQKIHNAEHLEGAIFQALDHPEDLSELRRRAIKEYLYVLDGQAARRLFTAIQRKLVNGVPRLNIENQPVRPAN